MVKKSLGRPPSKITPEFYSTTPTDTMRTLAAKKNNGKTWQKIADDLGDGITPAMVWKVTKGLCESSKIDRALGFGRQYPPTLKIRKDDLDSTITSICKNFDRDEAIYIADGILNLLE